jgi:hypothetical protein
MTAAVNPSLPSYMGTRILLVGRLAKFTFSLLDGGFTRKQRLPAGKGRQQQEAQKIALKMSNSGIYVFLAKAFTSKTF